MFGYRGEVIEGTNRDFSSSHDGVLRHFLRVLLLPKRHTTMLIYEWTVFNLKQLIFVLNLDTHRSSDRM